MFIVLKVSTVRAQKYQKKERKKERGIICRNTKFLSITYNNLIFIVLKVLTVRVQKYQKEKEKKRFVGTQSILVH